MHRDESQGPIHAGSQGEVVPGMRVGRRSRAGKVLNRFGDFRLTETAPRRSRLSKPCEINATITEPRPSGSGFPKTVKHPRRERGLPKTQQLQFPV
jgi:hypothetical protein